MQNSLRKGRDENAVTWPTNGTYSDESTPGKVSFVPAFLPGPERQFYILCKTGSIVIFPENCIPWPSN